MMTLFNLALTATCRVIDIPRNIDYIEELELLQILPVPIKREVCRRLKTIWMKHTRLPLRRRNFEYRYLNFNQLDKHEFIMLTHHPRNQFPDFWPGYSETAHIYFEYYEFFAGEDMYVICGNCFNNTTHDESLNWRFYSVTKHYGIDPSRFVNDILRSESSWCDLCVLTPLFQLYSWESCTEYTRVHELENDSDSDESITHVFERVELSLLALLALCGSSFCQLLPLFLSCL